MLPKRHFHLLTALLCVSGNPSESHATGPTQPDIVVILTDDMGYGDLSCQGHPQIRTPHLDRLAAEGQRWTSFYASAPLCNPSRVAMMTGRMPIRIHRSDKNQCLTSYGQPGDLRAYRMGDHKLVFESWESLGTERERGWRGYDNHQQHDPPLLFNLTTGISERLDIAGHHPGIIETIREAVTRHEESLGVARP